VPQGRPYPIAFFLTSFEVGGTERQMVELIRRLDRTEFEVHVACFHRGGPLEARALENVASVASFPINGFGRPSAIRQWLAFARWCRRIGVRIVHTCELYSNVFGLPAAALAGVDVRIGNRRDLVTPDRTRAQLVCQRAAYKSAHSVVANCTAAAEWLHHEGIPARKIQTIPNGVDCAVFSRGNGEPSKPIRRVVTVANLRAEKGHDTLIDAAATLVGLHPDLEFQIVGGGPLRAALEREVTVRGLGARVRFLGERDDVPALLASSDLFVLPSRSEACPNGVLEAMAVGLPIVASRVGGIPELIDSGVTGVLIEPDTPELLVEAVLDLVNRPKHAWELGRAAREKAESRFSLERMVSSFERLYRAELQQRAVSSEPGPELAAS